MSKLRMTLAFALLVAAMIVAAVATAASGDGDGPTQATAPTAAAGPDSFAVFRRPAVPADQMPPAVRQALAVPTTTAGVNLDDARAVAASGTGAVWAIPGPRQICLAQPDPVDGFAIACAPIEQAVQGRLWTGLYGLPGQVAGDVRLAILVPDRVQAVTAMAGDGTGRGISVSDNVAFGNVSDSQSIQFDDAGGTQTIPVAGTPAALVAGR